MTKVCQLLLIGWRVNNNLMTASRNWSSERTLLGVIAKEEFYCRKILRQQVSLWPYLKTTSLWETEDKKKSKTIPIFFCNWGDLLFVLLSELQFVTNIFEILFIGNSIHLVTIWFLIESKSFLFEAHKIRSSKFNLPESLVANKFWQIGAKNIPLDTFPFFFKGMYPMKCYFGKGRKYVFQ